MRYLVPLCQGLLAVVLVVSATSKLRSVQALRAFTQSLSSMQLVRATQARPVAIALAAAEAIVAALLLLPATRDAGFAGAATLLAVLTGGVAVVISRGTAQPCRCFGDSSTPLSWRHLIRNLLLCAAATAAIAAPHGEPPLPGTLVALFAGAVVGLLVTAMDDLVALFAPTSPTPPPEETPWRT